MTTIFHDRTYAKIAELARPRANSDTRGRVSLLKMNGCVSLLKMNGFA